MSPINFEYSAMLIYRLKQSNRASLSEDFKVSTYLMVGSVYFPYRKIVGGEIINTPLTSSVGLFRNARL